MSTSLTNADIVMEAVPKSAILLASSPKFREKFALGTTVPNEMSDFDKKLPLTFTMEDAHDLPNVLAWLIEHKCEERAQELCIAMFSEKEDRFISGYLNHDERLIDFVKSAIAPNLNI